MALAIRDDLGWFVTDTWASWNDTRLDRMPGIPADDACSDAVLQSVALALNVAELESILARIKVSSAARYCGCDKLSGCVGYMTHVR